MKRPAVQIASIGRSVPDRVMTNYDFAAIGIETTHEWVMERTGISERHIAGPNDTTCSMGAAAARIAMQRAGVQPAEIDVIICSTATPDRLLPATAVEIQADLGASRAAAFDISAACCGFLYGMTMAEGLIQSGSAENVLLVSSEKMSAIIDWTDRATCVLFGDGAGAAVLRRSQRGRGILSTFMRSDGTLADLLYRPAGGATTPMSAAVLESRTHLVHMAGREVFKHAVRSMAESADRALDGAKISGGAHRPSHSASGEPAHHRGNREAREHSDEQGLRERRSVRQHVVGLDSDRARRSDSEGSRGRRLARDDGGLRRRLHVGVGRRSPLTGPAVNIVLLFPGQGSQKAGMGKDLAAAFPAARRRFSSRRMTTLGAPLSTLCFEGPDDELTATRNAQPALLTHGAAVWAVVARSCTPARARRCRPFAGRVHRVSCRRCARLRGRSASRAPQG